MYRDLIPWFEGTYKSIQSAERKVLKLPASRLRDQICLNLALAEQDLNRLEDQMIRDEEENPCVVLGGMGD